MITDDLFSIAGKTALVTGGAQGIGLMVARGFVEAGAKVYIAALEEDLSDKVAAELSELPGGGTCVSLPIDLSTEDSCRQLARAVAEREDRLNILVNNAGVGGPLWMRRHTHVGWRKVMSVNLEAMFFLTRELRPLLKTASREGDPARVLNMGSTAGLETTEAETFSYSASKAGVHHLTARLARTLAPEVTVNALAPYAFESVMMKPVLLAYGDSIPENAPLKRIGRPDDMVGITIWLASRAGSYVTGAVIPVAGGSVLV